MMSAPRRSEDHAESLDASYALIISHVSKAVRWLIESTVEKINHKIIGRWIQIGPSSPDFIVIIIMLWVAH